MGIWDKIVSQLVDIIEWTDDSRDTIVWRFPRFQNEIKYGAKLVVRESQVAAFINEGKLADVYVPGTYTLTTQNMPILATLKGWKYGFNSPFKAEVYFVNTRMFTDRKWGTKNPIMLRDPEFGPVRLRAFGTFAFRVKDAAVLLRQVAGTDQHFTIEEIGDQLRDLLVARFANALGDAKVAALDLAQNYDKIGAALIERMRSDFDKFGLELPVFAIENISLPAEVEAAMDKRSSMGVIGNMQSYTQYQTANAIGDAANNPGGIAGVGAGIGAGFAVAGQMSQAVGAAGAGAAAPPPIPQAASFYVAVGGKQTGPFDVPTLASKIASGEITRQSLVWKPGMPQWTPAESVQELLTNFAQVPPPLPPTT